MSFGPSLTDWQRLSEMGLKRYLESQLHPDNAADTLCNMKLSEATLHIEYKASDDFIGPIKPVDKTLAAKPGEKPAEKAKANGPVGSYPAMKEDRPLLALGAPIEELWKLTDNGVRIDGKERARPTLEVRAASWLRAVYSEWQLREVMVEFWHNHFNVAVSSGNQISATMPIYDRIMRNNWSGNFRVFLEQIAQSAAMQFYLNNVRSKASPANENFARELFELHTLGADHYYNSLYNRWREVPGAVKGHPIGYIDQDVYEAARSFTGWTIEDGTNTGKGTTFPKTGKFTYFDGWHDNYQKRVLGNEFDPNSPPLADGRKVLDLVASHPGTAMFLCTKLCRRFVADDPPPALVKKAAAVWQKAQHQPDQIAQVLRTIILSREYAEAGNAKIKRPMEYIASFLRATGADFMPNEAFLGSIAATGYRQFDWPSPTGHPDIAEYWLNTNTTLGCWNLLATLAGGGFNKTAHFDLATQTPANVRTNEQIIAYWVERLTGSAPDAQLMEALMQYMPHPNDPHYVPDIHHPSFAGPQQQMVLTIAMLPEFQVR